MSAARAERMKLVKKLRKAGMEVERDGSGHWKVTGSNGTMRISFSPRSTDSRKTLKRLRDIGFEG